MANERMVDIPCVGGSMDGETVAMRLPLRPELDMLVPVGGPLPGNAVAFRTERYRLQRLRDVHGIEGYRYVYQDPGQTTRTEAE